MDKYPDFIKTCGIGHIQGIGGVNCRHSWSAVSETQTPNYSEEQLEEMHEQAEAKKPYKYIDKQGNEQIKMLDQYAFSQYMRRAENEIRKTRARIAAYKAAGADELYNSQKIKYRKQYDEYKKLADQAGLRAQTERISLDGLKLKDL
jgi:hypothetical protein